MHKSKSKIFIYTLGFMLLFLVLPAGAATKESLGGGPLLGCDDQNRVLMLADPPMQGTDVRSLQQRLQQLGLHPGPADGVYGNITAKAVNYFQSFHGLPATGQVDAATWQALGTGITPAASTHTPRPTGLVELEIDTEKCRLTVLNDGVVYKVYPVGVGEEETPSPVGEWQIIHKSSGWGDGFGSRWMGLNVPWGIYGIHGTNKPWSVGWATSHGCFRMHNRHVEEVYSWVSVGTKVRIVGKFRMFPWYTRRSIKPGATGQDVVLVQTRLKELGLYWGRADGRYGKTSEGAIRYFQLLSGLPDTGVVDGKTYKALGF